MTVRPIVLMLASSAVAWCATPQACEPAPEIRDALYSALAREVSNPSVFDRNIAPFLELRNRYGDDLTVHEQYQDAVNRHGIEGHLRQLTEEYQILALQHPDDLMYRFLAARSLTGRATPNAIRSLNEVLAEHPDFAPAHRMLAEIYGSEIFRDAGKQEIEKQKFLSLCPGSSLTLRPSPLPEPSPLLAQSEQLNRENGDPDRILAMTTQALRDDEWRNQRIRAFDWYSAAQKRASLSELQARYWKAWSIQVRCYRKAGRAAQANELLAQLDQRAMRMQKDPGYWDALEILVQLYSEGQAQEQAKAKLEQMDRFLSSHPDPDRQARLEILRSRSTAR